MDVGENHTTHMTHISTCLGEELPPEILEGLETASFDTLALKKDLKQSVAVHLITNYEGSSVWVRTHLSDTTLVKFVSVCEGKYQANPFHNFDHALDVQYASALFLR